jgi:hypothetical protein
LWELCTYNHRYDRINIPEARALLASLGQPLIEVRNLEELIMYLTAEHDARPRGGGRGEGMPQLGRDLRSGRNANAYYGSVSFLLSPA